MIADPWTFAQRISTGKTSRILLDGARASAMSSQTTVTKSTNARLCARAFQELQMRRKITGSASQQMLRSEAPRRLAKARASTNADPTATACPSNASLMPPTA